MVAACGSVINRIDIGTRRVIDPIDAGWPVNCLTFDDYAALLLAGGQQVIAVWSLSGGLLTQITVESAVTSIAAAELLEFIENRFFVTGHANGSMKFWTINYETMALVLLKSMRVTTTAVRRIAIDHSGNRVVCLTSEGMFCFGYIGSGAADLKSNTQSSAESARRQ
jgi:WD40 repeat protein